MKYSSLFLVAILFVSSCTPPKEYGDSSGFDPSEEGYYYQLITLPIPENISLEIGGLDVMDDGRPIVATRRGEVWMVDGAYQANPQPGYSRFAQGLHEPLGLLVKDGAVYTAQRGELTRMIDEDGDEKADLFETVYAWPLTGNYHEYSYGPLEMPNGNLFVSLNLGWFGYGDSRAKWRGWALEITPEGDVTPMAVGFRSPAGIGITEAGDIFYGENQGDWIGSGWITHIEAGDFLGHPGGLVWSNEPDSPIKLTADEVPNTGEPMFAAKKEVPELKLPTIWFPHTIMGISTSSIIEDNTGGDFGPFAGQLLVGDQGHSKLMRVYLEKVNGAFQGANFPFYEGFASGILRTAWGKDNSLFVGQTSRGWSATGKAPFALERLIWTGEMPFEMKEIQAKSDGFDIVFTLPVDAASVMEPDMFKLTSFAYKYHNTYGSPAVNVEELNVTSVSLSEDGLTASLKVDGLREGYIHEIRLGALKSQTETPLLHDFAFYTLNNIPESVSGGMGQSTGGTASASATSAKWTNEMPASWNGEADHAFTVATVPGLRFDVASFEVDAGNTVAFRFNNNDDMLHNLVITTPGAVDDIVTAAQNLGIRGQEMNYVPVSDDVLFHSGLLEPETEETMYFVAPSEAGDYPFVCTFPGHGMTMRGILKVR
ncbi:MAG: plastocyanin/azurin family copper-binding protein [Rhodothermales bacterium]